jgi:hypothetical protein
VQPRLTSVAVCQDEVNNVKIMIVIMFVQDAGNHRTDDWFDTNFMRASVVSNPLFPQLFVVDNNVVFTTSAEVFAALFHVIVCSWRGNP